MGGAGAAEPVGLPTDSPDHWRRRDFTAGRWGSFTGSHRRTPPPAKQPLTATPQNSIGKYSGPYIRFLEGFRLRGLGS